MNINRAEGEGPESPDMAQGAGGRGSGPRPLSGEETVVLVKDLRKRLKKNHTAIAWREGRNFWIAMIIVLLSFFSLFLLFGMDSSNQAPKPDPVPEEGTEPGGRDEQGGDEQGGDEGQNEAIKLPMIVGVVILAWLLYMVMFIIGLFGYYMQDVRWIADQHRFISMSDLDLLLPALLDIPSIVRFNYMSLFRNAWMLRLAICIPLVYLTYDHPYLFLWITSIIVSIWSLGTLMFLSHNHAKNIQRELVSSRYRKDLARSRTLCNGTAKTLLVLYPVILAMVILFPYLVIILLMLNIPAFRFWKERILPESSLNWYQDIDNTEWYRELKMEAKGQTMLSEQAPSGKATCNGGKQARDGGRWEPDGRRWKGEMNGREGGWEPDGRRWGARGNETVNTPQRRSRNFLSGYALPTKRGHGLPGTGHTPDTPMSEKGEGYQALVEASAVLGRRGSSLRSLYVILVPIICMNAMLMFYLSRRIPETLLIIYCMAMFMILTSHYLPRVPFLYLMLLNFERVHILPYPGGRLLMDSFKALIRLLILSFLLITGPVLIFQAIRGLDGSGVAAASLTVVLVILLFIGCVFFLFMKANHEMGSTGAFSTDSSWGKYSPLRLLGLFSYLYIIGMIFVLPLSYHILTRGSRPGSPAFLLASAVLVPVITCLLLRRSITLYDSVSIPG